MVLSHIIKSSANGLPLRPRPFIFIRNSNDSNLYGAQSGKWQSVLVAIGILNVLELVVTRIECMQSLLNNPFLEFKI